MWETGRSALTITSGEELERFDLGDLIIRGTVYTILTGYENDGKRICWWCGSPIEGRRSKHFCDGHRKEYLQHFEWTAASRWCKERAGHKCQLCDIKSSLIPIVGPDSMYGGTSGYRVHHIVPVNGGQRYYTVFNLPWNLVALCHTCHMIVHAIMSGSINKEKQQRKYIDVFEQARLRGQGVLITV